MARRPADANSGAVCDVTPAPVLNRGWITVSIMLATFMQGVDTTIANVALPHMQGSFSVAQDQIAWVVTSYIVAAAIMTPLTGWLASRFGIKWVFFVSVVGFTLASALCGSDRALLLGVDQAHLGYRQFQGDGTYPYAARTGGDGRD